jgi:ankyrin repeat protein
MMMNGKRIFLLVVLGLVTGFGQAFAAQSAERALGQTAQPAEVIRVAQVWVRDELVQKVPVTATRDFSGKETLRPVYGSIFVLIEFVLVPEEATINLVLVDSTGTRYTPVAISPFSTVDFLFFVSLERVISYQFPGTVEVTKDKTTRQLTIKVAKPGTKFTAAWEVPQACALRRSEFKLHIADGKPIVIDTLASAREMSLHVAARAGQKEQVARLLAEGAVVNAKDDQGWTPLHGAARNAHAEVIELLLTSGAEINAKDNISFTPLHLTVSWGHKEVAELLLARGAEVNAKDNEGQTPLHRAVGNGHTELAELLLGKGADVNARDNISWTPLHRAASWGRGGKEVTELLLASGAEVNAKDNEGRTPLHWAAANSHTELAELLLTKGADVNARNAKGETPLSLAKADEMKALLRKFGAK